MSDTLTHTNVDSCSIVNYNLLVLGGIIRRVIFVTIILIAISIGLRAQELMKKIKVEKVKEIKSVEEYNKWVQIKKENYPSLRPCYIQTEIIKWGKEWRISYFDEAGDIFEIEILKAKPGWWLYVQQSPYLGRVSIIECDSSLGESALNHNMIKNMRGDTIYSFTSTFHYPTGAGVRYLPDGSGLFIPHIDENYAELVSWEGEKIGTIENLLRFNIGSKATPDGKYMVLNSGFTAIVIKNGRELWRKNFSSAIEVGISADGQYIGIGDASVIYIYNIQGDLSYSFCFSPTGITNPRSVFSSDNYYLVASLPMELALINNKTGDLIWRQHVEGDAYRRHVYFAKGSECIVLGYLGRIYIYDLEGNLLNTIRESYTNLEVFDDLIVLDTEKDKFSKIIYQLK